MSIFNGSPSFQGVSIPSPTFNSTLPDLSDKKFDIPTYIKPRTPFGSKINSFFSNNPNLLGTANTLFTGIFGEKDTYDGTEDSVARGIDSVYDTVENLAPPGFRNLLQGYKLAGNVLGKVLGSTSGNTFQDSLLDSTFFRPLGVINATLGSKTDSITKNEDLFADVGSSFGGTGSLVDDALTKANKKYGLLSGGARHKANNQIREARRQQDLMEIIGDYNSDRRLISQSTSAINHNNYMLNMQGGYDQSAIRVGKKGLKISPKKAREIARRNKIKKIQKEVRAEEVTGFQKGGKTPEFKERGSIIELSSFIELISPDDIPEFKEGGSINVIPDGALHARKHNMDIEGITKKGIPVVSNDGEQQAEVEREELIIRLEVTQKLEELQEKFYNEETSKKEKDELALEAGKLLAYEILHNTQDNTNNLL